MNLAIKRSPQARADVIDRAYYIAGSSSFNASDKFLTAVEAAYKQLSGMPGLGSPRDYGPKFPKYLIFYRATETELTTLRVLHGAQNIQQIFTNPEED